MHLELLPILRSGAALVAGVGIGLSFGMIQRLAWQRHQKLQREGQFNNGWLAMPGSMRRVAYLLIALVLIQVLCPLLFVDGCQWWVSGGVVAGYGALLFRRLREQKSQPS
jgi:hypothetical protein